MTIPFTKNSESGYLKIKVFRNNKFNMNFLTSCNKSFTYCIINFELYRSDILRL